MHLLISGYYGFGNLGDEALLAGLVGGLQARAHQVTILSRAPAQTKGLHGVKATSRLTGLLPALLKADVLISGGGGLLQDKTSRRSLQYYLGVIRLAKLLGKRVIVYGQSVGPLSDSGKEAVAKTLRGVAVAVRDERSQVLLESLGIRSFLTADAALLLSPPVTQAAPNAPVVLIPRGGYPDITEALCELARALQQQDVPVTALALHAAEDSEALQAMKQQVPTLTLEHPHSPHEVLNVLAGSSYVVSGRLHGLILAAVAGKPFSGLIYDPKVAAFLREAGAQGYSLPVDSASFINQTLRWPKPDPTKVSELFIRVEDGFRWLEQRLDEIG